MQLDKIRNGLASVGENGKVILDFDHTLWLGNSTEQFIRSVKPRILGELLDGGAKFFWCYIGNRLALEKDQFRVLLVTFFAPWSWLIWWSKSRESVARYWNQSLYDQVTSAGKPVVIVSHGFEAIIRPLLKAKFSGLKGPPSIASKLLSGKNSIRQQGKIQAIEEGMPTISWVNTLVVSDSLEDQDLLAKAGTGVLTQWEEPEDDLRLGYFPMRYVGQGKYPGWGYVTSSILGKDLVVWLLLYTPSLSAFIPALLLFFSLQAIYEIGYYENDFAAAKSETMPTLSENYCRFINYNIGLWAWVWALVMGVAGCCLYFDSWQYPIITAWLVLLLFLRGTFYLYNKAKPQNRVMLYLVLQTVKSFAGLLVILPTLVGILLAVAHIFQHSAAYIVYRCQGNKKLFGRAGARLTIFFLGIVIALGLGGNLSLAHLSVGILWVGSTLIIEKMGGVAGLRQRFRSDSPLRKNLSEDNR